MPGDTVGTAGPSPSLTRRTRTTATQIIAMEETRCRLTTHGLRSVSTEMPPITAWSGTPTASTRLSRVTERRPCLTAATNIAIATAAIRKVTIRLPNSTA